MKRYYSATTGATYLSGVHASMPADAKEISDERYLSTIANTPAGKKAVPGLDGLPILVDADSLKTFDDLKAEKLSEINRIANEFAKQLTAGYPEWEKDTWPDQQREILAWEADNTTPTPCLDAIAQHRGMDIVEYRTRTLAKVKAFQKNGWYVVGARQGYEDQIKAAKTQADLDLIVPVFTLPE
jgi:hypothetical protein